MNYDTAKLRQFINDHFGPQDLNDLLFDYFRSVHEDVTPGMTKRQHISLLLKFCRQHSQMQNLLAAVAQMRPFFQPNDYVQGQEAPTAAPQPPASFTRNSRQIFISHAHQDAAVAQKLAHDLATHGYDIWIAPDSIRPGEKWVEAINRGLEESGIFVLLLSPEAVASRWVKMETNVAITYTHEDEMQLYPLMLKACRLPALWRAFQHISLRSGYEQGFNRLVRVLDFQGTKGNVVEVEEEALAILKPAPPKLKPVENPDRWLYPKTGIEMVRIPAGKFLYGDDKKTMHLDEFWIAKTPLTNAQYKLFLDANLQHEVPFVDKDWAKSYNWDKERRTFSVDKADHPVVLVSWHDAKAYAAWAGLELPTEQQWEKAARGVDGKKYPWGDDWRENHGNTREAGLDTTSPVGQFSPQGDSPYGCVDMSGNVWEWTASEWSSGSPSRALCGGSWFFYRRFARVESRHDFNPFGADYNVGFRLVAPISSGF